MRRDRIIGRYTGDRADPSGRRVIYIRGGERSSQTFSTPERAAEFIRHFQAEVKDRPQTLAAALDLYCIHKASEWADTCEHQRRYEIGSFFGALEQPLASLTTEAMQRRYDVLMTEVRPRTKRPLAAATHRLWLRLARYFLRWCVAQRWMATNPLDSIKARGAVNTGKPQLRRDETRRLLAVLNEAAGRGDLDAIALLLIFWCATSPSEVLRRQVRDLDDGGRILWVDSSRIKDGVLVPSKLKTKNRRRQLTVPSYLLPVLQPLLARRGDVLLIEHERGDGKWLWERLAKHCRTAGVPRISPYSLRGMQATLRAAMGAAIDEIAKDLGNTPTIAREHYVEAGAGAAHA